MSTTKTPAKSPASLFQDIVAALSPTPDRRRGDEAHIIAERACADVLPDNYDAALALADRICHEAHRACSWTDHLAALPARDEFAAVESIRIQGLVQSIYENAPTLIREWRYLTGLVFDVGANASGD